MNKTNVARKNASRVKCRAITKNGLIADIGGYIIADEAHPVKCARLSLAIVVLLVFAQAWAQSEDEGVDPEQDFEHPGADVAELKGDGAKSGKDHW